MTSQMRKVFVSMGSTLIRSVKPRDGWVFAGRAGAQNKSPYEKVSQPDRFGLCVSHISHDDSRRNNCLLFRSPVSKLLTIRKLTSMKNGQVWWRWVDASHRLQLVDKTLNGLQDVPLKSMLFQVLHSVETRICWKQKWNDFLFFLRFSSFIIKVKG